MLKSKSQILREDLSTALRLKSELDLLERYLSRVFKDVQRDQKTIRKYMNVLILRLNKYHQEDLAKLDQDEIKSKDKSSTGPLSTIGTSSTNTRKGKSQ